MTTPTRLLLMADTHVPRRARDLPDALWRAVDEADLVLHAGDWVDVSLLDALESRSRRLVACYGNNDGPPLRERLPEVASVDRGRAADRGRARDRCGEGPRGAVRGRLPGAPTSWSSGTATSRGTPRPREGCGCSTRGRRPTAGASRTAPG